MRYDQATAEFMEKVAEEPPEDKARSVLSGVKKVVQVTHNPTREIPRALIGAATKELLKEGAMPPLKVFDLLNAHYGKEWWDWEPETMWVTLEREQGVTADDALKNILQAFQVIVTTDAPFEHWHIFEKVGHALNQNPVEFQIIQPLELDEVALTLKVLSTMRSGIEVDDEVCGYIAAAARSAGVVFLPKDLFPKCSQEHLDKMNNELNLKQLVSEHWEAGYDGKVYPRDPATKHQLDMLLEVKNYVESH